MTDSRNDQIEQFARALLQAQDLAARLHTRCSSAEVDKQYVRTIESSIAYRLGSALVAAGRSLHGLLALPRALATLARDLLARSPADPVSNRRDGRFALPALPGADLTKGCATPPLFPGTISELRVAAVMDEFTRSCFAPDCCLLDIPPEGFEAMIEGFAPHLLFVESAWRGKDDDWMHKIQPLSPELIYLVDFCWRRGIPTVFWNKEDPAHFDGFLEAARLFDHVFTTDGDCIPAYREALGHDRVHVLSFSCQPQIHNPVETVARKEGACFAGSWYQRYPERSRDFERLVDVVSQVMPVDIYDRNHGRGDPAFAFPARYQSLIQGHLPYHRIDEAYKGYRFAITVNTVKTSPTMFSRRVYELLACNTVTISNDALGLKRTLGDHVVCESDSAELAARLRILQASVSDLHRLRLRGLREVLEKHTAAHRLVEVAERVLGDVAHTQPRVEVLARVDSRAQAEVLMETYQRQRWPRKRLHLVVPEAVLVDLSGADDAGIVFLDEASASKVVPAREWPDSWVALWHPKDHYGRCYLTDLMLATAYASVDHIGKGRHFAWEQGRMVEHGMGPYKSNAPLWHRASIARAIAFGDTSVLPLLDRIGNESAPSLVGLAIDEFNYCRQGGEHCETDRVDVDP